MSDLHEKYDVDLMTWNSHDRAYHEKTVDTIYSKVAEILIAQNERFFLEQDKHKRRIEKCEIRLNDHDHRLKDIEMWMLRKKFGKAVIMAGGIIVGATLLLLLIF